MSGSFLVEFSSSAARQFLKLPYHIQKQISPHIDALEDNPRPSGSIKLKGTGNGYRIRVGDYRILYETKDDRLIILIVKIARRSKAYK